MSISSKSDHKDSPRWICVQWGAAEFRAWAMHESGAVMMRLRSPHGLARVALDEIDCVLTHLLDPWLLRDDTPVMISGLSHAAGEDDLFPIPAQPAHGAPVKGASGDPRISLYLLPGLRQDRPPDYLIADGAMLRGLLADHPDFDGAVCIPGQDTRWVRIRAREVIGFQSHMTGELVTLLSQSSSLATHLAEDADAGDAFIETVNAVLQRPGTLLRNLSGLRARAVLGHAAATTGHLAGSLIGADLAAARRFWVDRPVIVVGGDLMAPLYRRALAGQGCDMRLSDPDDLTLAGFRQAYAGLGCRTV